MTSDPPQRLLVRLWLRALRLVESAPEDKREVGREAERAPEDDLAPASPRPPRHRGLSPSWLWLLCLALLPFSCSGAVRYVTALNMSASLALSILLWGALALLWFPRRARRPVDLQVWISGALCLGLVGGAALVLFYNGRCYGLPTLGAIDPVGHLMEMPCLTRQDPLDYWGMTAFHGLVHWLQVVGGLDVARAFRLVIYGQLLGLVVFFVLVQGCFASHAPGNGSRRPGIWLIFAITLLLGVVPATAFLFPMIHGYQLDGFYPHLQGLLPLFFLTLVYSSARYRLLRLAGLCLGILVLRFSYYLNIVDVVVTCALVVIWEVWTAEGDRVRRWVLTVLSLISLGMSGYFYSLLYQHHKIFTAGGIPATLVDWKILGTTGLSLLLLTAPLVLRRVLGAAPGLLRRLCLLSGVYGLVAVAVQGVWFLSTEEPKYLLHKYGLTASLLVIFVAVPYVSYLLAVLIRGASPTPRRGALTAIVLVIASASIGALVHSVPEDYATTFRWRVADQPSPLSPLADLTAWDRMREILRENGRRFGAFLAPLTTETYFAGYGLGDFPTGEPMPRLLPGGPMAGLAPTLDYPLVEVVEPDTCIFWLDPALFADISRDRVLDYRRGRTVRRLHADTKACVRHLRPAFSDTPTQLCYTCFEGSTRDLPLEGAPGVEFTGFGPAIPGGRRTRGEGTIRLAGALDRRCSLKIRAVPPEIEVRFDGDLLEPLLPAQHGAPSHFGIPSRITAKGERHTLTLGPADHGAAGVLLKEISLTCLRARVPPPRQAGGATQVSLSSSSSRVALAGTSAEVASAEQ